MKRTIHDQRCKERESTGCQTGKDNEMIAEIDYSRKPLADVIEKEAAYELYLDMPGVEQENLEVLYDQGELRVKGTVFVGHGDAELVYSERPSCSFSRSFSITEGIDPDKITARLENGVVRIELGKTAAVLPKRIEIQGN